MVKQCVTFHSIMNTPNSTTLKKIGILGGTFDPIHYGHIKPAINNAKALSLDSCILLPANIPPHKASTSATSIQRKAMVELVCQEYPLFTIDERELNKNSTSYTIESLKDIHQEHDNAQIFFIIGMDSLITFSTWHQWQDILNYCHLLVNVRPGFELSELSQSCYQYMSPFFVSDINEVASEKAGKIIFQQQVELAISSTELRQEIAKGKFNNPLLPQTIAHYIQQNKLYQT